VSGTLDTGDLVFTNYLYALNDYGEAVTFGATLSFRASFDLPGTLTGQSGSELDVQLTESNLLTPLLTSDPSGNIAEISYDQPIRHHNAGQRRAGTGDGVDSGRSGGGFRGDPPGADEAVRGCAGAGVGGVP
jgi:hypothetical protein